MNPVMIIDGRAVSSPEFCRVVNAVAVARAVA